jgi:hypothetical protein
LVGQREQVREYVEEQHILIGQASSIRNALHLTAQITGQSRFEEAHIAQQPDLRTPPGGNDVPIEIVSDKLAYLLPEQATLLQPHLIRVTVQVDNAHAIGLLPMSGWVRS